MTTRHHIPEVLTVLEEIKARYEQMIREFPKADELPYYQRQLRGVTHAIAIMERLQERAA